MRALLVVVCLTLASAVSATSFVATAHANSIDRELLRRVLRTAHPAVAACRLPPERYVVRLVVEPDGRVSDVTLEEPLDASVDATRCVTRAFARVVFPAFGAPPPPPARPRRGEPRSHLPPATPRVGHIVVSWPFVVRAE